MVPCFSDSNQGTSVGLWQSLLTDVRCGVPCSISLQCKCTVVHSVISAAEKYRYHGLLFITNRDGGLLHYSAGASFLSIMINGGQSHFKWACSVTLLSVWNS